MKSTLPGTTPPTQNNKSRVWHETVVQKQETELRYGETQKQPPSVPRRIPRHAVNNKHQSFWNRRCWYDSFPPQALLLPPAAATSCCYCWCCCCKTVMHKGGFWSIRTGHGWLHALSLSLTHIHGDLRVTFRERFADDLVGRQVRLGQGRVVLRLDLHVPVLQQQQLKQQ